MTTQPLPIKTLNKSSLTTNNSFITSSQTQRLLNPSVVTNSNENTTLHPPAKTKLFARITDTSHLLQNNAHRNVPKKLSISAFNLKSVSSQKSSASSSNYPSVSCDTKQSNSFSINSNTSSYQDNNNDSSKSASHLTIIEKVFNDIAKIKQYTTLSLKHLKKSKSTVNIKHAQVNSKDIKELTEPKSEALSLQSIHIKQSHSSQKQPTLCHTRNFDLPWTEIQKNAFNIYAVPSFLKQSQLSNTSTKVQLSTIIDKSVLILDNITYFKSTYMFSGNFQRAFRNLTLRQKATFNKTIEDTCSILTKLPPLLMKHLYESLDQILYCAIPNLNDESKKRVANEDECMKENYKVFIEVTNYYMGCVEVFKIVTKKIRGMKFNRNTYCNISLLLDTARYNTSSLNSFAHTYIDKMKQDLKLLNKLEENLHLKQRKRMNRGHDFLERFRNKDKKKLMHENEKRNRISAALNMEKKDRKDYNKKYYLQHSLLNLNVITQLMNYIDKPIREKIIAQRVVERYKENEINSKIQMENQNK